MTEAGDLLPCQLADELATLCAGYTATSLPRPARAVLVSECVVSNLPTILAALRNTRAPITPSVDKLVGALRPFAEEGNLWLDGAPDETPVLTMGPADDGPSVSAFTLGDLRRAAAVAASIEAASSTPLVAPSDRSQRAVVEAAYTRFVTFRLEDDERKVDGKHLEIDQCTYVDPDWPDGVRLDFNSDGRLISAALQPPAADNATRTEDGLADEAERLLDEMPDNFETILVVRKALQRGFELASIRTTGQPPIAAAKPVGKADV